jgi:hypothetical protein
MLLEKYGVLLDCAWLQVLGKPVVSPHLFCGLSNAGRYDDPATRLNDSPTFRKNRPRDAQGR